MINIKPFFQEIKEDITSKRFGKLKDDITKSFKSLDQFEYIAGGLVPFICLWILSDSFIFSLVVIGLGFTLTALYMQRNGIKIEAKLKPVSENNEDKKQKKQSKLTPKKKSGKPNTANVDTEDSSAGEVATEEDEAPPEVTPTEEAK